MGSRRGMAEFGPDESKTPAAKSPGSKSSGSHLSETKPLGSKPPVVKFGPSSGPEPDIRAIATAASLRSLFFAALPVPITLAAITVSPRLPYAVGPLVSFALVAACVFLAIFYGCRVLRVARQDAAAEPEEAGRRSAASIAASAVAGRALARRRGMGVVGIVLGGLHGLFLLGSLALSIPGMFWLASVQR